MPALMRHYSRFADASRWKRLADVIDTFGIRWEETRSGTASAPPWALAGDRFLTSAQDALQRGDLDRGWTAIFEAERCEVEALAGDALRARAIAVQDEAKAKLQDWRRDAVGRILAPGDAADVPLRQRLKEALRIRNEHYENTYRKIAMRRERLLVCAALGAALLATTMRIAVAYDGAGFPTVDLLRLAMVLGAVGALLSVILSAARDRSGVRRIPEHLDAMSITLVRPVFGALFGVATVIALRSGVLNVFDGSGSGLALAALLAGFSERWFLGILGGAMAKPIE